MGWIVLTVVIGLTAIDPACAGIDAGLRYLVDRQATDGSWPVSELPVRSPALTTARAAAALARWDEQGLPVYGNRIEKAAGWLCGADRGEVEIRSDRIALASEMIHDPESLQMYQVLLESLYTFQDLTPVEVEPGLFFETSGFGFQRHFSPDAWDTAAALRAVLTEDPLRELINLPATHPATWDPILGMAVFLINEQISAGTGMAGWPSEWSFSSPEGGPRSADPYVTALGIDALASIPPDHMVAIEQVQGYPADYDLPMLVEGAIVLGITYVLSCRNESGNESYFNWPGNIDNRYKILLTAAALRACLVTGNNSSNLWHRCRLFLENQQLPNGSWENDVFLTAEVLLALDACRPNLSVCLEAIQPDPQEPGIEITIDQNLSVIFVVENQGARPAPPTMIDLFLKSDTEQIVIATKHLPYLDPGQILSSQTISGFAPYSGTFRLGIAIDPQEMIDETDETDNIEHTAYDFFIFNLPILSFSEIVLPESVMESDSFDLDFNLTNAEGSATAMLTIQISADDGEQLRVLKHIETPVELPGNTIMQSSIGIDGSQLFESELHLIPGNYQIIILAEHDSSPWEEIVAGMIEVLPSMNLHWDDDPPDVYYFDRYGSQLPEPSGIPQIQSGEPVFLVGMQYTNDTCDLEICQETYPGVIIPDIPLGFGWRRSTEAPGTHHPYNLIMHIPSEGAGDTPCGSQPICSIPPNPDGSTSCEDPGYLCFDTAIADGGMSLEPGLYYISLILDGSNKYIECHEFGEMDNIAEIPLEITGMPDLAVKDACRSELTGCPPPEDTCVWLENGQYFLNIVIENLGDGQAKPGPSGAKIVYGTGDYWNYANREDWGFLYLYEVIPGHCESLLLGPLQGGFMILENTIWIAVDTNENIQESDENNNIYNYTVILNLPDFQSDIEAVENGLETARLLFSLQNVSLNAVYPPGSLLPVSLYQQETASQWIEILSEMIEAPPPGETRFHFFGPAGLDCGQAMYRAEVNPDQTIPESNYSNNSTAEIELDRLCLDPDVKVSPCLNISDPQPHVGESTDITTHIIMTRLLNYGTYFECDNCDIQYIDVCCYYYDESDPSHLIGQFQILLGPGGSTGWEYLGPRKYYHPVSFSWMPSATGVIDKFPIKVIAQPFDSNGLFTDQDPSNNIRIWPAAIELLAMDFMVNSYGIRTIPDQPVQGQNFQLSVTVTNLGSLGLDPDQTVSLYGTCSDPSIDEIEFGSLWIGRYQNREFNIETIWPAGNYILTTEADYGNEHLELGDPEDPPANGANNFASTCITVGDSVNLIAESLLLNQPSTGYACAAPDDEICIFDIARSIDIAVEVTNDGLTPITSVSVTVVSPDNIDFQPLVSRINRIEPSETYVQVLGSWTPADPGTMHLLFVVDPYDEIDEGIESENDNSIIADLILSAPDKPDLAVINYEISGFASNLIREGDRIELRGIIENTDDYGTGGADAGPFKIRAFFSQFSPEVFLENLRNGLVEPVGTEILASGLSAGETLTIDETPLEWDTSGTKGSGYLYLAADADYVQGDAFYAEVDEIIEHTENLAWEFITIHPDGGTVDSARRSGIIWLLDHQCHQEIGTECLTAYYFNLDTNLMSIYEESGIPDSFGHAYLSDSNSLTDDIEPVYTRQIGYSDDIYFMSPDDLDFLSAQGVDIDHFAIIWEGYIDIGNNNPGNQLDCLTPKFEFYCTESEHSRGWIWINNRIMTPYSLQLSQADVPRMNNLSEGMHWFQAAFIHFDPECIEAPSAVFRYNCSEGSDFIDLQSPWLHSGTGFSHGLWDTQTDLFRTGIAAVTDAGIHRLYSTPGMPEPPLILDEYISVLRYILDTQSPGGSWGSHSLLDTGICFWALTRTRILLDDGILALDAQNEDMDDLIGHPDPISGYSGAIGRTLAYFNRILWSHEDIPAAGTGTWGTTEEDALILVAMAELNDDADSDFWSNYIPSKLDNNPESRNMIQCALAYFAEMYLESIDPACDSDMGCGDPVCCRYWGKWPGDPAAPWLFFSPVSAIMAFGQETAFPELEKAGNYIIWLRDRHWKYVPGLQVFGLHYPSITHAHNLYWLKSLGATDADICAFLHRILPRELPSNAFSLSDAFQYVWGFPENGYYFNPIRINGGPADDWGCLAILALLEIRNWIYDAGCETYRCDLHHEDRFPPVHTDQIDAIIHRLVSGLRNTWETSLSGVPVGAHSYESYESTAYAFQALNTGYVRLQDDPSLIGQIEQSIFEAVPGLNFTGMMEMCPISSVIGNNFPGIPESAMMIWSLREIKDCFYPAGPGNFPAYTLFAKLINDLHMDTSPNMDGGWGSSPRWWSGGNTSLESATSLALIAFASTNTYNCGDPIFDNALALLEIEFWQPPEYQFNVWSAGDAIQLVPLLNENKPSWTDFTEVSALEFLGEAHQRLYDGGWNIEAGATNPEPSTTIDTAWALLAMGKYIDEPGWADNNDFKFAVSQGVAWLIAAQISNEDPLSEDETGGWGLRMDAKAADTLSTAIATWALNSADWESDCIIQVEIGGGDPPYSDHTWRFVSGDTVLLDLFIDQSITPEYPKTYSDVLHYQIAYPDWDEEEPIVISEYIIAPENTHFTAEYLLPMDAPAGLYTTIIEAYHIGAFGHIEWMCVDIDKFFVIDKDLLSRDLALTQIQCSSEYFVAGESVTTEIQITCTGPSPVPVSEACLYDGDPGIPGGYSRILGSVEVPPTAPGDTVWVSIDWTAPDDPGWMEICAVVDPQNILEESDESNNKECSDIQICSETIEWIAGAPDPFSPAVSHPNKDITEFLFYMNSNSAVTITIYHPIFDPEPEIDRIIVTEPLSSGENAVIWDGCDTLGYIVQLSELYGIEISTILTGTSTYGSVEVDNIVPISELISPQENECVGGIIPVVGTVTDLNYLGENTNFDYAEITFDQNGSSRLIARLNQPVIDGQLAEWDTSSIPEGNAILRAETHDTAGNTTIASRAIYINHPPDCPQVTEPAPAGSAITVTERDITVAGIAFYENIRIYLNEEAIDLFAPEGHFETSLSLSDCETQILVVQIDECGLESNGCQPITVTFDLLDLTIVPGMVQSDPLSVMSFEAELMDLRTSGMANPVDIMLKLFDPAGVILNRDGSGLPTHEIERLPWIEDGCPGIEDSFWEWVEDPVHAISGSKYHRTSEAQGFGVEYHGFTESTSVFQLSSDERLVQYVWLNPDAAPDTVALTISTDSGTSVVYWGQENITEYQDVVVAAGPVPNTDEWIRLEIDPDALTIIDKPILAMAFYTQNGLADWDRSTAGIYHDLHALDPSEIEPCHWDWFTDRNPPGSYRMEAEVTASGLVCDQSAYIFEITPDSDAACEISSGSDRYNCREWISIVSRTENAGGNVPLENLEITIEILNGENDPLAEFTYHVSVLEAGESFYRVYQWFTGDHPPGICFLNQSVKQDEVELTYCSSQFSIVWNPMGYLVGSCYPVPETVVSGDPINLNFDIQSQWYEDLPMVYIWFEIFSLEDWEKIGEVPVPHRAISLPAGSQSVSGSEFFETTSRPEGEYGFQLWAEIPEIGSSALALSFFTILTPTPIPTPSSSPLPSQTSSPTPAEHTETPTSSPTASESTSSPAASPTQTHAYTASQTPGLTATVPATCTNSPIPSQTPTAVEPSATIPVPETPTPTSAPQASPSPTSSAPGIPTSSPTPEWKGTGIDLWLNKDGNSYSKGNVFDLILFLLNETNLPIPADLYLVLDVYGSYWFWPSWSIGIDKMESSLPPAQRYPLEILSFIWPEYNGSFTGVFIYAAALKPGTSELIGEMDYVTFGCNYP
ncbi:hypothetical protein JXA40_07915 [bacterium]|nr:hypothetical protein [candidate division CSSED10-310 bacterium]